MSDQLLERRRAALAELQRASLVEGFVAAVDEKGYTSATIADIARAAHVSKSTFYEHFADKEALFLHLHATVIEALREAYAGAVAEHAEDPDWHERVRALVSAFLACMASTPAYLTEIRAEPFVGTPAAQEARHQAGDQFAGLLAAYSEELARSSDDVEPLSQLVALTAIGGQTQIVARTAAQGPQAVLDLEDPLTEFWVRLLS